MLVYEPVSPEVGPVPLVRLVDNALATAVAETAVAAAEARASEIFRLDEMLGEIEQSEARRLRDLLCLLVPGFGQQSEARETNQVLM